MDKERILQMVLTPAVIGSLALVAGAIVTGESSEWQSTQIAGWRGAHGDRTNPQAPPPASAPELAQPEVAPAPAEAPPPAP